MSITPYDTDKLPHMYGTDPVSDVQVMQSAAGYYLGRSYWDVEYQFEGPYSRDSGYFATEAEAQAALAPKHTAHCVEYWDRGLECQCIPADVKDAIRNGANPEDVM